MKHTVYLACMYVAFCRRTDRREGVESIPLKIPTWIGTVPASQHGDRVRQHLRHRLLLLIINTFNFQLVLPTLEIETAPTTLNTEVAFWVCHHHNHYHHQYSERVWCVEKKRADCIIIRRIEDLEVAELWAFHLTLWMWWMSIWHRDAARCEVSDHLSSRK